MIRVIRINLLPPAEQRRFHWPITRIMLVSGLLMVFCCVSGYGYNMISIWRLEKESADMKNQYELLRPAQAVMVSVNSKQHAWNEKNNILIDLTSRRRQWPLIVNHLTEAATPRIWFTNLGITDKDSIKITGVAENYRELAAFLDNLEHDDGLFTDPFLVQAETVSGPAARFEIVLKLKGMKQ